MEGETEWANNEGLSGEVVQICMTMYVCVCMCSVQKLHARAARDTKNKGGRERASERRAASRLDRSGRIGPPPPWRQRRIQPRRAHPCTRRAAVLVFLSVSRRLYLTLSAAPLPALPSHCSASSPGRQSARPACALEG